MLTYEPVRFQLSTYEHQATGRQVLLASAMTKGRLAAEATFQAAGTGAFIGVDDDLMLEHARREWTRAATHDTILCLN